MKIIFRFANVIIFMSLLFVSCSGEPNPWITSPTTTPLPPLPASQNTSAPAIPGFSALLPVTRFLDFGITQIEFLVDKSGSMDTNCGELGKEHQNYVDFMLDLFKERVQDNYKDKVIVGVSTFASDYQNYISQDYPGDMPPSIRIENQAGSDSNFEIGIQGAHDKMLSTVPAVGDVAQRYLIIITDGDTGNIDELVKKIENRLNSDKKLRIYVTLWCQVENKSQSWLAWDDETSSVFRIFANAEDMTIEFLNLMRPVFPENMEIEQVGNVGVSKMFGGYITGVNISYWNVEPKNSLGVVTEIEDSDLESGKSRRYSLNPLQLCYSNKVAMSTKLRQGLVVFFPDRLQDLGVSLNLAAGDKELEVVNSQAIDFRVEIANMRSFEMLEKWKDCFSTNIVYLDGSSLNGTVELLYCDDTKYYCSVNDNVFVYIRWTPLPAFNKPGLLGVKIRMIGVDRLDDGSSNISTYLWESGPIDLSVKFQPTFSSGGDLIVPSDLTDPISKSFLFNNVLAQSQPEIYLLSDLSMPDFEAARVGATWDLCPKITTIVDNQLFSRITNQSCSDSVDHNILANVCALDLTQNQLNQFQYNLSTYDYSIQNCGYKSTLFIWNSSNDIKSIALECNLIGTVSCKPVPVPPLK